MLKLWSGESAEVENAGKYKKQNFQWCRTDEV